MKEPYIYSQFLVEQSFEDDQASKNNIFRAIGEKILKIVRNLTF